MELIDINEKLQEEINKISLNDLFPKEITYTKNGQIFGNPSDDAYLDFDNYSENYSNTSVKYNFTKLKPFQAFDKNIQITCLKVLKNILAVTGGQYLKLFNMEKNYEMINAFKIKEPIQLLAVELFYERLDESSEALYFAAAGEYSVIYFTNLYDNHIQKDKDSFEVGLNVELIGHRNHIYDLKFSKKYSCILLSASKDNTIRLWNAKIGQQICIFGGFLVHYSEVFCIDWHQDNSMFVSGSVDNTIKIFNLSDKIMSNIYACLNKKKIKTIIKNDALFSCSDIHSNLIDCVKFNGNFVLSKSVDGVIKEWFPCIEDNKHYMINTYIYTTNQKIYGVKFHFEMEKGLILIGNEMGDAFIFKLNENTESYDDFRDDENMESYSSITKAHAEFKIKNNCFIKCCEYDRYRKIAIFGGDSGEIFLYSAETKNKK